jgi:sulfhydrogenase subunit alpha
MARKILEIPVLTRVEGEGALTLQIENNEITKLQLRIFEPPRLFEKFLEGRGYEEVLDFVARICGICPIAYQMTAAQALEKIFNLTPTPWIKQMRRLFYYGEWLSSHSTHIHLLAMPDFFGFNSASEMAKVYPEVIRRGLRLQAIGNELIKLFGARSVHPVGACVGGFFRAPMTSETYSLLEKLKERLIDAENLLFWIKEINFPSEEEEFISVALREEGCYSILQGRIVSDHGLNIEPEEFESYFEEYQVPYSHALHCKLQGKSYLVGPLARLNLNLSTFPDKVKVLIENNFNLFPSKNMFHSMLARAIEIYYCIYDAINILQEYETPVSTSIQEFSLVKGVGVGATEAPRGLLWHRYELNEHGMIINARIIAPTGQNQSRMEENLAFSLKRFGLEKSDDLLRSHSEKIIRNYDPCISCSTHFLNLRTKRV